MNRTLKLISKLPDSMTLDWEHDLILETIKKHTKKNQADIVC
jgi:hypothetical protein